MKYKRFLATILTIVMVLCSFEFCAFGAESGKAGNSVIWTYEDEVLIFSGSGPMYDYGLLEDKPWSDVIDKLSTEVIIEDGITYVGKNTLTDIFTVTLTVPKSVKEISSWAMYFDANDTVIYEGTEDEWEEIYTGDSSDYAEANMYFGVKSTDEVETPEKPGDNLEFSYDEDTSTLIISGSGDMYDFADDKIPWDSYPHNVIIEEGVTSIGKNAFFSNFYLNNIVIPKSIEKIDDRAFSTFLETDVICFGGSESQWESLTDGLSVFSRAQIYFNTSSLEEMPRATSAGSGLSWDYDQQNKKLTISGKGKMDDFRPGKAPWGNETIVEIEIEEGVTEIGDYAFDTCSLLTKIIIPKSMESFSLNSFPKSFSSPLSVYYYGDKKAWDDILCSYLLEDGKLILTSELAVTSPGLNLKSSYLAATKTLYISGEGRTFEFDDIDPTWDISNAETVVFSEGVTHIGSGLFKNLNVKALGLPKSLVSVSEGAFDFLSADSEVYYAGKLSSLSKFDFNGAAAWANASVPQKNYSPGDNVTVIVDGGEVVFDAKPFIEEGRTLVPVRAIFEAMDAEVVWDSTTKTVYSRRGDVYISLEIDNNTMTKRVGNGETERIALDVAPKIYESRTYVPVRAIAESFDAGVEWEKETRTVDVKTNDLKLEYASRQRVAKNYNFMPHSVYFDVDQRKTSLPYDVTMSNGKVFYSLAGSTSVFVYDGIENTEYDLGGVIYNMLASGNKLYYIDSTQCVCVLDISTGITQELFELPDKIEIDNTIIPEDYVATMKLYNGILSVTVGIETENNRMKYNTYNIDVKNGKTGMSTSSTHSYVGREYYASKLYAKDKKTILASGVVQYCDSDADKTVYVKFDRENQNLGEWERAYREGMGFNYYGRMSLYVVDNDGQNNNLVAQITSGSDRPNTSTSIDSGGSANIEPERACGLCNGSGRIECTFCDGSGRVEEYDTLNHQKVTRTCPRSGCFGGQIDCPGC